MRKFKVGQKVYWNDPAGETSGEYTVLDPLDERNKDTTEEDIENFDYRMILIGNGASEAEVNAEELEILCPLSTGEKQCMEVLRERAKSLKSEMLQTMKDAVEQFEDSRLEKPGHSYVFLDESRDRCEVVALEIIEGQLSVELDYSEISISRNVPAKDLDVFELFEVMNLMLEDEVW